MTAKISVVLFSGNGHTLKMGESVVSGANSVSNAKASLVSLANDEISYGRWKNDIVLNQLDNSDAIIFGTPTYMGGPAAQFKAFADATSDRWFNRTWMNKIAAGFSVSGGPSGDKFNTIIYLFTFAMQHGMIWVGVGETPFNDKGINRLGSYAGAMGQALTESPDVAPNEADKLTAQMLGKRVAEATIRWIKGA